jgi:hypothetical protein
MLSVEQSVEWELVGETEVLGENLPTVPLCPTQIPHDLTWARTWDTAAVGSRRLTASAWPSLVVSDEFFRFSVHYSLIQSFDWVKLTRKKCTKFRTGCCRGSKHCREEMHSLRESALSQRVPRCCGCDVRSALFLIGSRECDSEWSFSGCVVAAECSCVDRVRRARPGVFRGTWYGAMSSHLHRTILITNEGWSIVNFRTFTIYCNE